MRIMDFSESELVFLRDVVKSARQKPNHVIWTDRDGSERHSVFSQPDFVQLATLAGRLKVTKAEVLRRAAHIPVVKTTSV